MKNLKSFQKIVLVVFGIFGLLGVAAFAIQSATSNQEDQVPSLTIWGTLPSEYFAFLGDGRLEDPYLQNIEYREFRPDQFDRELVEALADGDPATGPDMVVLSEANLYEHKSKLQMISYEEFSASQFDETYIPIANIFLFTDGIAAIPTIVDPLVMYWNEPLLATHGYTAPPRYWDQLRGFGEKVTQTEEFLDITQSAVSLGTFDNVDHAKAILSLLLMQSGSPIVAERNGDFFASFSQTISDFSLPPNEALNFYTEFADPSRQVYSWNTSLPSSRDMFLAEDLALYFGYASERYEILEANPNLAFNVARMPQVQDSPLTMTYGRVYGFAALKGSDTPAYAKQALYSLMTETALDRTEQASGLPSIYRARLSENPRDPDSAVLVQSAREARTWLDPDDETTRGAFRSLVSSVRSNQRSPSAALSRLRSQIDALFD